LEAAVGRAPEAVEQLVERGAGLGRRRPHLLDQRLDPVVVRGRPLRQRLDEPRQQLDRRAAHRAHLLPAGLERVLAHPPPRGWCRTWWWLPPGWSPTAAWWPGG